MSNSVYYRHYLCKVYIPEFVCNEFLQGCSAIEQAGWQTAQTFIEIIPVLQSVQCKRVLGAGEQAVLASAIQMQADVLIMDDRKAVNEAIEQGLTVVSTRAVLKVAAEKGIITSYEAVEQALRDKRFFLPNY